MKGNLKKLLVVGILAVLTLSAFSMLTSPSVKAAAAAPQTKVVSYSWYVAPQSVLAKYVGDLVCVGEVQNVGSNVIGNMFVIGVAYNSTGAILDSDGTYPYFYDLLPGQMVPFYIDFTPATSITHDQSWVSTASRIDIEVTDIIDRNGTQYSGLTVPNGSSSDRSGTYSVTGTIHNTGGKTTGDVWVDTTFYNASGTVVALNYTTILSSSLSPGATVTFTATPADNTAKLSSEIANYSLLIQSEPLTTSASPTPSGSSSSPVLIYTVVVIVAVIVVVTVLVFLRKRRSLPPPPPPPPPPA